MLDIAKLSEIRETLKLPDGFLGDLSQIGIVTHDLKRTVNRLLTTGIGPWRTYTFDSATCTDIQYMGQATDTAAKIALANMPGLLWEVIQPLRGPNVYSDFLIEHGEGMHHLLFKCNGYSWQEKTAAFAAAGYRCTQSGKWQGTMSYAYYDTDRTSGVLIEITDIPSDWKRPEADEVYE